MVNHNSYPLNIDWKKSSYRAMIGVGGIGAGVFFALKGNHILGREESRSGHFLDRDDYCKLHIVSHYVKVLLGSFFNVIPIGRVGDDETGRRLFREMADVGLDMNYVEKVKGEQTLFSFCFIYPNGSGGNLTTNDSACSKLTGESVNKAEGVFKKYRGKGIAVALPEVSLDVRKELLELGTEYDMLRVASFTSGEIEEAKAMNILRYLDFLALNLEEAKMLAGIKEENMVLEDVVSKSVENITSIYPGLILSITAGRRGSWTWDGKKLVYVPSCRVNVVSTAGAGDAYLSGIIAGWVAGLKLGEAQELGTLVGSLSVTTSHTIHEGIDRKALHQLAFSSGVKLTDLVVSLLGENPYR